MNHNIKFFIIPVIASFLFSCTSAKKPSEVPTTYVAASTYSAMTCEQLKIEAERIRSSTPALEAAVQAAYKSDKAKEQVGWWLFAPALLFMEGNAEESAKLSLARGQLEAIQTAALDCRDSPTDLP